MKEKNNEVKNRKTSEVIRFEMKYKLIINETYCTVKTNI